MMIYCRHSPVLAFVIFVCACGGSRSSGGGSSGGPLLAYKANQKGPATPAPDWLSKPAVQDDKLCGFGVAGAGYNEDSPYPKELSEERAILNLAGTLGTRVQEAFIEQEKSGLQGRSLRRARVLTVDEALVEKVRSLATTEYWLDVDGEGPYASAGFTYALTCIAAKQAADTFEIDADTLTNTEGGGIASPGHVPRWMKLEGKQPGGRLCAVGFSLPMFFADKTFHAVVEDVRSQLATVLQTFVSSYFEELSTDSSFGYEQMTLATTEALSKGVVVTHYWYDRDGIGPSEQTRSTYGWGCIYPVQVLQQSADAVAAKAPEKEKDVIRKVRERARSAFDDLDAEIAKREAPGNSEPEPVANARDDAPPSLDDAPPNATQ